ncbi:MAG: GxxExxY protein [Halobacteriota archaeon]
MKIYKHREITEKIIGAAQRVHNTLGYGFLEKVYQNALVIELRKLGFKIHEVQLVNYLKATGIEVGLLINFGRSLTVKRRVMDKR